MAWFVVGTRDGLRFPEASDRLALAGRRIDSLKRSDDGWWTLADGSEIWFVPDTEAPVLVDTVESPRLNCLLPLPGEILIGAAEARLLRLDHEQADGAAAGVDATFDDAAGRSDWYTPWGGLPDVRSLGRDADGRLYVNVHVGGILRQEPDDVVWHETMDIHADVHEVTAHPTLPGSAFAATAKGLAVTNDGARSWTFHTDGLHADYCRAVAVFEDRVYVSASRSSRGTEAAVYHTTTSGSPLVRCETGLPTWFTTNVNTGCIAVRGHDVVIGDASGVVYTSADDGDTWSTTMDGLDSVTCVAAV